MLFFKYQKPGNLEFTMLRRGEIYFASPSELNDAHECRPRVILSGSVGLWRRLARFLLEAVCFEGTQYADRNPEETRRLVELAGPVGQALKKRLQNRDLKVERLSGIFLDALVPLLGNLLSPARCHEVSHLLGRYIDTEFPHVLEERRYIASFSLSATNPTMWAHYADAEKGFVIIFASSDRTIHIRSPIDILPGTRASTKHMGFEEVGIYNDARLELEDVRYGVRPPKVNGFHQLIPKLTYSEEEDHYDVPLLIGREAARKQESSLGLIKYSDWRYEKEVRMFLPTLWGLPPDARALRVASKNIVGLIFGPTMSPSDKGRAVVCCHLMRASQEEEHSNDFAFFQAQQRSEEFNLGIRAVGIIDGYYFENHLPLKLLKDLPQDKAAGLSEMAKAIVGVDMKKSTRSSPTREEAAAG